MPFDFLLLLAYLLNNKNPPPSIQMSREKRAKDMNVMFRETISVWISSLKASARNEMTLFRLERELQEKRRRFA